MKSFRIGLAIFLAILMAAISPMTTLASADSDPYIKEIRVAYGVTGKSDLEDAGYKVWDVNVNDSALGKAVWLGYKTTSVKSEAITDIAVMNMNGGYSFTEYQSMIDDLKKAVQDKQEQVLSAVTEFKKNYAAGSDYAKAAAKVLKCFYYDEVEGENKISLLDLFTADELDKDAIYKICLEGNTESMDYIVSALSLGIIEYAGDTALTRLKKVKYGTKSGKSNVETKAVTEAIEKFKLELAEAEKVHKEATAYEGGVDAYLENKGKTVGNAESTYYYYLYEMATGTQYGTSGLTLYQAMTLPLDPPEDQEEESEEITWIDSYIVSMLTKSLTYGQIGVLGTVGLGSVLCNAYAVNLKNDNPTGVYKSTLDYINESLKDLDNATPISVFAGVDRSLIEHPEDVAITTEALRKEAKKQETQYGVAKQSDWMVDEYKTFQKVAVISGLASIGACIAACCVTSNSKYALTYAFRVKAGNFEKYFFSKDFAEEWLETFNYYYSSPNADLTVLSREDPQMFDLLTKSAYAETCEALENAIPTEGVATKGKIGYSYSKFATALHVTTLTISAIAMVVSIVFIVLKLITEKKIKEKKIEYTKVPRAIIDTKTNSDETTQYCAYYAAKQYDAKDDETDYKKIYGDLNAFNEIDQWLCLYYSKDASLGEPLTTNVVVRNTTSYTTDDAAQYLAVHDFGFKSPKDLNYYNSGGSKKTVCLLFERSTSADTAVTTSSASIFNLENATIAIAFLAIGAAGAFFITYAIMKKKKKENVA